MQRFDDEITREVYEVGFSEHVPKAVASRARIRLHALAAAHSLQDVGVLGDILRWRNAPPHYGLQVYGKWHVTFEWSEDFGAHAIRLERR